MLNKYKNHIYFICFVIGMIIGMYISLNTATAATSIEYGGICSVALSSDTGISDVVPVAGCVSKIEDPDEDVVCYITPLGGISCLELKGN